MGDAWPLAICVGSYCVLPLLCVVFGIWIGRNRIRLRSPLARGNRPEEYATPPDERARAYVRSTAQNSRPPKTVE